uniref:NADH-ubiquinone oxidoreductase chain 5 n=1 Tax=Nondenticentrus paramelanicus TaxID=3065213 RepID=A0AA95SUV3_9HEMI|nr:NADH dehydrogenase subunit 5 [Nondenticentrus paramelanicus]WKZ08091.1 NADH dehydrogenase subunit 5 [Nondenticentrus paramelanicus]
MFNKYLIWFFNLLFLSIFSFYLGLYFMYSNFCLFLEYSLIYINSLSFYYVLIFDFKSLFFVSVVLFISSMVILYSSFYMGYLSFSSNRFLYLVLLFIFSMFLMIMSPNLISILLGWDGLGLVSYCLVIYYSSLSSNLSGMITCLTNRLGDIGILICIGWMMSFGGWNFIFYNFYFNNNIFFLMVLSSFTKSAQIPFSCWLPAAMAAPTPVSSLVHSSTLVTAGVYLLIRFFDNLDVFNYLFVLMGLFTMIFSSFCANYEFDLKKIIAFSTLSQLGLMMTSIFLGFIDFSFFHLLTHAMFKSLLFLCSGVFIYFYMDNQDIRFLGGCCNFLPLTSCCFNISNMALCGIPFLSGFYSKDLIIEISFFSGFNFIVIMIFYFSLGLTCCYSFRLIYYSLISNFNFSPMNCMSDEFNFMGISVLIMSLLSIIFGCIFNWLINLDLNWIFLPLSIKILSLLFVLLGLWFGFELNSFNYLKFLDYYFFNSNMWFMLGYSMFLTNSFFGFFFNCYKILFWGEFYLTLNMSNYLFKMSDFFQINLNNTIKIFMVSYLLWFLFLL